MWHPPLSARHMFTSELGRLLTRSEFVISQKIQKIQQQRIKLSRLIKRLNADFRVRTKILRCFTADKFCHTKIYGSLSFLRRAIKQHCSLIKLISFVIILERTKCDSHATASQKLLSFSSHCFRMDWPESMSFRRQYNCFCKCSWLDLVLRGNSLHFCHILKNWPPRMDWFRRSKCRFLGSQACRCIVVDQDRDNCQHIKKYTIFVVT